MKTGLILLSTIVWDLLLPTLLGAPGPHVYWPKLAVFWVCFLAEEEPEFIARASEVFWSGLVLSVLLGLLTDFAQFAPRGVHASIFALSYFLQRVLTRRELSRFGLFLTVGIATGLIELAVWYVKGFEIGWIVLPRMPLTFYVAQGVLVGGLAVLAYKPLQTAWAKKR